MLGSFIKKNHVDHSFPTFFTGGENVHWTGVAMSILAMNITFEYVQSSSANGFNKGLAMGSFEWTAIFVMIFASFYVIPHFLRAGVLTLCEYLELRYDAATRVMMACLFLIFNAGLAIVCITSSALFIRILFDIPKEYAVVFIAALSGILFFFGGAVYRIRMAYVLVALFLVACTTLFVCSIIEVQGFSALAKAAEGRLRVVLPADSTILPWTTVFLGPLWILHLNFWAFYPPICQPMLGNRTLTQTQMGLLLVASIKIVLPFIMIVPGIVGFELFDQKIGHPDETLAVVIGHVVPSALKGIVIIGLLGTLFASYTMILNTATTIFTVDIFGTLFRRDFPNERLVRVGKVFVSVFVFFSVLGGYFFDPTVPFYSYATLFLEMVAPISVSIFLFALFTRSLPSLAPKVAIVSGIPLYYYLKVTTELSRINLSGIVFLILCSVMVIIWFVAPRSVPVVLQEKFEIKFERNLLVLIWAIFLITAVIGIYAMMI